LLVIEDEAETRLVYEKYLRDTNYVLIPAASLRQARAALRQVRPVAILLDILLRGEDSWQWLSEIKADEQTRDIPVLVVSTVEDSAKGRALGADAYLLKPVGRQQLIANLSNLVPRARLPRPGAAMREPVLNVTTALVVDDDATARYVLKRLLTEMAVRVFEAEGGAEALELAGRRPDVIFLDLKMPKMSGIEVLRSLRSNPATAHIPVLVVTSEMPLPDERTEIERSAQGFIEKRDLNAGVLQQLLSQTCGFGYDGSTRKSAAGEAVKPEVSQA
jgi:CheY-like chemotaxis protein